MAVGKNLATSLKASLIWFKEAQKKMWRKDMKMHELREKKNWK
jgi:hypothetical protein